MITVCSSLSYVALLMRTAARASITDGRRVDNLEIANPVILHPKWEGAELSPGALGWVNGRYSIGISLVGDSVWLN